MNRTDRDACGGAVRVRRVAVVLAALLLTGAAVLAQAPAPPAKQIVVDVIAQGNHNVPTQKIMSIIKTRPGLEYSKDTIAEDVKNLYKTGSFADIRPVVQPAEQGVTVYFQFRELPAVVQEIVYKGVKHLKQDDLDNITGLKKGVPLNTTLVNMARNALIRKYQEEGRPLASVEILEGANEGDSRVVFNVTEGPKCRVSGVDVVGQDFVTGARLKTQVNTSRAFLGFLGGKYNPLMVDDDVNKLMEYYKSFGFHDVRVTRELKWESADRVRVVFHVHEGQRYRVAKVDVNGTSALSRDELIRLVNLKPDDVYFKPTSDGDQARIKNYYGYRGREATVHERLTYEQPGQVSVSYDVEERPPARVGQIIIIGNEVTRENVIRRQIPLYPGQVLSYPDVRLAELNLARLNIFENNQETGIRPTVNVLDPDPDNPYKDVLVTVQETQTGSLLFGLGVNSDAGFTGSIVLNERNFDILNPPGSFEEFLSGKAFRGAGQEFRIEAVPGTQLQRYTVSWREPFLFDSPYSLGASGYYYDRVYTEYTETRYGGRIPIGRQLNRFWSASISTRVENVDVRNVPFFAPPEFTSVQGNNFLTGVRGSVVRDARDNFLRPTQGNILDLSAELVTGQFTFPVFNAEFNQYFTVWQRPDLSGRQVLALRSQVSVEGDNAPIYERFYAGGFRTMRGFEFRGVGPSDRGFMTGGSFMWLNSAEYQIPVLANDQLYFVGFVDSGTVEPDVRIGTYRVAAGVGARIVVPMMGPVPIALDFGFPIVKADTDRTQLFSFWVGFFH